MAVMQKPANLKEDGSKMWDTVIERQGDRLVSTDYPLLTMACRWLDRFNDSLNGDGKGADIRLGIATDKLLLLSEKFGLTPKDRKGLGDERPVKKAEKKKTKVDSMTPEGLGLRVHKAG